MALHEVEVVSDYEEVQIKGKGTLRVGEDGVHALDRGRPYSVVIGRWTAERILSAIQQEHISVFRKLTMDCVKDFLRILSFSDVCWIIKRIFWFICSSKLKVRINLDKLVYKMT